MFNYTTVKKFEVSSLLLVFFGYTLFYGVLVTDVYLSTE